jgi:hypothetical protein
MSAPATEPGTVLCLRSCAADMTSHNGFVWPREGEVVAPDWDPAPRCGGGLHGLLWGEGDGGLMRWEEDAVWLVFEALASDVVDLGGKVKVPRATVVMVGERVAVAAWLSERAPGRAVVSGTATAGYSGTATAGDRGTATAGDSGTATAGVSGTATAGYSGTATAGKEGVIAIQRWNGKRYRWTLGEIGETTDAVGEPLAADVAYRLDDDGAFLRAQA